ncbi:MAG: FAD:protein FMN transferase [Gammaproteobacteria bacterium]
MALYGSIFLKDLSRRAGLILLLAATTCTVNAEWFGRTEGIMGTEISVQLWHDNAAFAEASMDQVIAEMHRIDHLMSTYKDHSEISRVNANAASMPVTVGEELFELIERALDLGTVTNGAFDITYASVGKHYDFRQGDMPTEDEKSAAIAAISIEHVQLDPDLKTVRFTRDGVRIDLGGIAKGHAVESAVMLLRNRGIENAIVTAGGDSRVLGDHRGRPWAVGIRDPREKSGIAARMPVQEEAISTSGDYERYFEADGVRYHHIIEPTSGDSARGVRSVTIIGPDAIMTDALSTGVFVLGRQRGLELIDSLEEFEAIVIDQHGEMHFSRGLEPDA